MLKLTQDMIEAPTKKHTPHVGILLIAAIILLYFGSTQLVTYYSGRLFPRTYINDFDVSGMRQAEAIDYLSKKITLENPDQTLALQVDDLEIIGSVQTVGLEPAIVTAVKEAYEQQQSDSFFGSLSNLVRAYRTDKKYTTQLAFDEKKQHEFIERLNVLVSEPGELAHAQLGTSGVASSLKINPGVVGRYIDTEITAQKILEEVRNDNFTVSAHVASTAASLSDEELEAARQRTLAYVGESLTLTHEEKTLDQLSDQELIALLAFPTGFHAQKVQELVASSAAKVNRPPIDAVFEYDPTTLEVSAFQPDKNGLTLNEEGLSTLLVEALTAFEETTSQEDSGGLTALALPLDTTPPTNSLAMTNDLGILEEIGFGESNYHGSILSRVHNVGHTAEIINNTIVAPGEEYSFNKSVGNISRATGFQPAYVIMGGRTVLGDGGGVCQVSSTLFRSVLDSGLEITKRLPHSYRVSYYELNSEPGFDATVYSGDIDFRFKNDTDNHILVHAENNEQERYLAISIYGTSDGRSTEIVDYKTWGKQDPLPTQYIPTPDLPTGQKKIIDWGVGGINTQFTHKIYNADGSLRDKDIYTSKYRPWSTKYLVGE